MKTKNLLLSIFVALSCLFTSQTSTAQVWDNGKSMFHAGFALGGYAYAGATSLPAVGISYDKALKNDLGPGHLSVGGILGIKSAFDKYEVAGTNYRYSYRNTFVGLRGLYHLDMLNKEKWDVYGGLVLGGRFYKYGNSFDNNLDSSSFNILLGGVLGGQYFFTNRLGAFVEMGYSIGYTTVGVSLKL